MITHEQLVDAVYEKQISSVDCMKQKCKGDYCEECSENLVREYENEIRIKAIDEYKNLIIKNLNTLTLGNKTQAEYIRIHIEEWAKN